jgi:hypothetical protein
MKITFLTSLDKGACSATVLDKREDHSYFMEEGGGDGSLRKDLEVDTNGEGGRKLLMVDLGSWEANGRAHTWWR